MKVLFDNELDIRLLIKLTERELERLDYKKKNRINEFTTEDDISFSVYYEIYSRLLKVQNKNRGE